MAWPSYFFVTLAAGPLWAAEPTSPPAEVSLLTALDERLNALLLGDATTERNLEGLAGGALSSVADVQTLLFSLREEKRRLENQPTQTSSSAVVRLPDGQAIEDPSVRLRKAIVEKRLRYASLVHDLLKALPESARRTLQDLKHPRVALRQRIASLTTIYQSWGELGTRLGALEQIVQAGRLVGFAVDKNEILADLQRHRQDLSATGLQLERAITRWVTEVERQEAEGSDIRIRILTSVAQKQRRMAWDALFVKQAEIERRLRPNLKQTVRVTETALNLKDLARSITDVLKTPETLSTNAEAKTALAELSLVQEQSARLPADLDFVLGRFQHAYEREVLALFTELASEEVKERTFRISTEILSEIAIEVAELSRRIVGWGQSKIDLFRKFLSPNKRKDAWSEVFGWILGFLVLGVSLKLRPKSGRVVTLLVSWSARQQMFRGRVGTLVRLATLAHALAPTLVVLLGCYLGFFFVGWEHPEIQLAEVWVRWFGAYVLGLKFVAGLTKPVSRSRPALWSVDGETSHLLQTTYRRLGFFFALAFASNEVGLRWIGLGRLHTLIDTVMFAWVFGWGLWAMIRWRLLLSAAWLGVVSEVGWERALPTWMENSRWGAPLSPVAFSRVAITKFYRIVFSVLKKGGVISYLRAQTLKRLADREEMRTEGGGSPLPEDYVREFPLYPVLGEHGPVMLPREDSIGKAVGQIETWQKSRTDGSLVVVGGKGMGKTTFVGLLRRKLTAFETHHHTFHTKILSEEDLLNELCPIFSFEEHTVSDLVRRLSEGPDRVVLLDEVHNVFLRTIDGYRGFDALVRLVNQTSEKVFWVLVFNQFAWQFLNESRKRTRYFRRLLELKDWSAAELQDLISRRNQRSGYTVEFDEDIVDHGKNDTQDLRLVEGGESFFRLLRERSGGNPRIATYYWLESLVPAGDHALRVVLIRPPELSHDGGLTDEMMFVVASAFQHENLSAQDLSKALRLKPEAASFTLQFLREREIFELKEGATDRVSVGPKYYRSVLEMLRAKHLLFEVKS